MRRVRVKVCGVRSAEDALAAAHAGADSVGVVVGYPASSRAVTLDTAASIRAALPPFVSLVALFVDPAPKQVDAVLARVAPDLLQFHGDESPEFCARWHRPWLKAVRVHADLDISTSAAPYTAAAGWLLDTWRAGQPGGTGERFDWTRVPKDLARPLVLAGGLGPANVGEAIIRLQPWGVDVSSGVERAPGVKDPARLHAFLEEVDKASHEH